MKFRTILVVLSFSACAILAVSAATQSTQGIPPLNDGTSVSIPASEYHFHDTGAKFDAVAMRSQVAF